MTLHRTPRIEIACSQCGRILFRPPWRVRRNSMQFCGRACHCQWRKERTRGRYRLIGKEYEHRLVAESMLGRPLALGEVVHHINRDTHDNRPENLAVVTVAEHSKIHHPPRVRPEYCGCGRPMNGFGGTLCRSCAAKRWRARKKAAKCSQ